METKTLQEQIDKFYKETGYELKIKDGKPYYDGYLCLFNRKITKLPDNLTVRGSLDLTGSKITKLPENLVVGCSLYLGHSKIAKLPDNLVVGGNLYLSHTNVTELPDNLVVGCSLDITQANISKLPDNLVVGSYLDLRYTKITELPDNLVVRGWIDLGGTKVKKLPENLVVGGNLYLEGTEIGELPDNLAVGNCMWGMSSTPITHTLTKKAMEKIQKMKFLQWVVGDKTYIKVDGIFSVVDSHRGNVWRTHRIDEDKTLYVVTDGEGHYAHGSTLKEAKDDLIYKINDRDKSLYENLSLDDEVSFEDAIAMYRTITGACSAGTRDFIENRLPEPHKDKYTIKEIISLTDGEYGSETLKEFFNAGNR